MRVYLLLPDIEILNANAMSSTITVGFPAITAWLGGVHALQRKLNEVREFESIKFIKTGVVCKKFNLHSYKQKKNQVLSITANPLKKDGGRPSIIEEARAHLTVSLLIEINGFDIDKEDEFLLTIKKILNVFKLAGGDIFKFGEPKLEYDSEEDLLVVKKILRCLMPGYALIERRDLIQENIKENGLDCLIDVLAWNQIYKECDNQTIKMSEADNSDNKKLWRDEAGWLVPIAIGFRGITAPEVIDKLREEGRIHSFVEPVVTIGEFKMVYRFKQLDEFLWKYDYDENDCLYICKNQLI